MFSSLTANTINQVNHMNTQNETNQTGTLPQNQPAGTRVPQCQPLCPRPEEAIITATTPAPPFGLALELAGAATIASQSPPSRTYSRNGKIARLPVLERDMVNRMLQNNLPHSTIRDALEEHDIRVTERNISNWKTRGGYREWCHAQECALQTRLQQDNLLAFVRKNDASQLPEVGLQIAATEISQLLLQPEARQQLIASPEKYNSLVSSLCRLSAQLHTLQKYRDDSSRELGRSYDPEHIRREDEREVELTRQIYSSKTGTGPRDPDIPHRNFLPKTQ
jgi:hypothetical protein